MTTFRVHLPGETLDIDAQTAADARAIAKSRRPDLQILKVKIVKEQPK